MKHYKSVEFLSIFRVSGPPAQIQSLFAETQSAPIENFLATVLVWSQSQSLRFEFRLRSAALGCCSLSYWKCIC